MVSVCVFEPNALLNRTLSRQLACAWTFCFIRIFSGILSCSARSWPQQHSMRKPLKFWTLEVCLLCSTRVLRVTRLSRRARHTFFCGCFLPDQSKLSCFRQKMTGHHQISWWRRNFANHQKYRPTSSICICFLDQELVRYTMRYLLHFKKGLFFPVEQ